MMMKNCNVTVHHVVDLVDLDSCVPLSKFAGPQIYYQSPKQKPYLYLSQIINNRTWQSIFPEKKKA